MAVGVGDAWHGDVDGLVALDQATGDLQVPPADRAGVAGGEVHGRLGTTRGGTLIVIAHRISSAYRADGALMLEDGCATIGRHEYLIRVPPLYADMVGLWQAAGLPST